MSQLVSCYFFVAPTTDNLFCPLLGHSPAETGVQRPSYYSRLVCGHEWLPKPSGTIYLLLFYPLVCVCEKNAHLCKHLASNMQIRQSAAVMLRLRVKKHWKKISPNDRERFEFYFSFTLPAFIV